jgi:putative peptide zinc metalloprotease protein
MGLLFLVGIPIPYVDASSAAAFPEKGRRMAVGAAGIAVELGLASLALLVWLAVEPGLLREAASHVLWIGAISTLLFNGNPLLRFDGYYVLADALEIPNLASRSQRYLGWWVLHRLFGVARVRNPAHAPGEAKWLACYGVASFLYRTAVLLGIALFLASRFFVAGVALAIYALLTQMAWPLLRHAGFLLSDPRLAERRRRALAVSLGLGVALPVLALALPAPSRTLAEGVIWPPPGSEVRAGADGFVAGLVAPADGRVAPGELLLETRDETLEARVAVADARLRELRARHLAEQSEDRVRAEILREELASAAAELARLRDQQGAGVVRSPGGGRFVPVTPDLAGRYVRQGELLGWVLEAAELTTARVVVAQDEVARIRERTRAVALRLSRDPARVIPARLEREVPAATNQLPSAALGALAGGRFAIDRSDPEGLHAAETIFQLDLGFDANAGVPEMGGRVLARFDHGWEALGLQLWRGLRGLLLARLGV